MSINKKNIFKKNLLLDWSVSEDFKTLVQLDRVGPIDNRPSTY